MSCFDTASSGLIFARLSSAFPVGYAGARVYLASDQSSELRHSLTFTLNAENEVDPPGKRSGRSPARLRQMFGATRGDLTWQQQLLRVQRFIHCS